MILNIITCLNLLLIYTCNIDSLKSTLSGLTLFVKLFPYLGSVASFNFCFSIVVKDEDMINQLLAVLNLLFLLVFLILHEFINESLKFREKDYCCLNNGSYTGLLLLPTAILTLQAVGPFYAALFCTFRAAYKIMNLFTYH